MLIKMLVLPMTFTCGGSVGQGVLIREEFPI